MKTNLKITPFDEIRYITENIIKRSGLYDRATEMMKLKLKNHFGVSIKHRDGDRIVQSCDYILSVDPSLASAFGAVNKKDAGSGTMNTYISRMNIDYSGYVKLDENTYLFISIGKIDEVTIPMNGRIRKSNQEMNLYFFGKHMYKYYKDYLKYLMTTSERMREGLIYCIGYNGNYMESYKVNTRDPKTVISNDFEFSDVIETIDRHMEKSLDPIYKKHGLQQKIGVLLDGEPGTGKSSFAVALATYYNATLVIPDMACVKRTLLSVLRGDEDDDYVGADAKTVIVLLEDIDYIFGNRKDLTETTDKTNANDLLQILDGAISFPGRNVIFVATTNDKASLDPALTRRGRFDIQYSLNKLDMEHARRLCDSFECDYSVIPEGIEEINPSELQAKILNKKGEI